MLRLRTAACMRWSSGYSQHMQVCYDKEVIRLTPDQFGPPVRSPTLNQE